MKYTPYFGTDPHHIIRRDAPDTSIAAGHAVDTKTDERIAFGFYCCSGKNGLTSKELAYRMQKPLNAISGRITALRDKGLIEDSGQRRGKCRIMVATAQQLRLV